LLLQVALQLTAFSRENRPKCVVFCAKCGENLASYTETGSRFQYMSAGSG
jgi:hypothetical protein